MEYTTNPVKLFVSLMILFVAINLLLTIYNSLKRRWRESFNVSQSFGENTSR